MRRPSRQFASSPLLHGDALPSSPQRGGCMPLSPILRSSSKPLTPPLRGGSRPGTPTNGSMLPPGRSPTNRMGSRPQVFGSASSPDLAVLAMRHPSKDNLQLMPNVRRNSLMKGLGLEGAASYPMLSPEEQKARARDATNLLNEGMESEDSAKLAQGVAMAREVHMDRQNPTFDNAVHFLQQLEARESLEHATKYADIAGIKRALANARQAGLEGHSVQQGEIKLEKLSAHDSLMNAMGSPESGALRIAIRRAQLLDLGMEDGFKDTLATAERTLEQLEAHRTLSLVLQSKEKDFSKLVEATNKAMAVGVFGPELDQAQLILEESGGDRTAPKSMSLAPLSAPLSKIQEVQEQLFRAINLFESGGLRDSIRRAEILKIDVPELHMAKQLLAQIAARRLLDAALKGAIGKHDEKKLKAAVAAAEECGMQDEDVHRARQILEEMQVREELSVAISSKDPAKILAIIPRAKAAGVDRSKILKAETAVQQMFLKAAEAEQKAAAASEAAKHTPLRRSTTVSVAGGQIAGTVDQANTRKVLTQVRTVAFG